jgi:hypothetical protein
MAKPDAEREIKASKQKHFPNIWAERIEKNNKKSEWNYYYFID